MIRCFLPVLALILASPAHSGFDRVIRDAKAGVPLAGFIYSTIVPNGDSNPQENLKPIMKAMYDKAVSGDAMAAGTLGNFYANSRLEIKDYKRAHQWFRVAVKKQDPEMMVLGATFTTNQDPGNGIPLHRAAFDGDVGKVGDLLARGADINQQNEFWVTALQIAAERGHAGVVQLLLSRGAKVTPKGSAWSAALPAAVYNQHEEIAKMLLDAGDWIEQNRSTHDKRTPIFFAAMQGNEKLTKLLIERGANLRHQDSDGHYPADMAAANRHRGVWRMIVSAGGRHTIRP